MRIAGKQLLILEILRDHGRLYGLQLVAESGGKLKRGTVYATLGRMADKGWVVAERAAEADHSGLPRPRYKLTAKGLKLLAAQRAWLEVMGEAT